jgi:cell pole-organizing protein PopZ
MAQASSAQREPSMEEILASIRRIIEDNDAGRKQDGEPEQVRAAVPAPVLAQAERTVIEVDAFRNELRTPAAGASGQREAPQKKPTLQEIQAQITAEAAAMPSRWMEPAPAAPPISERPVSERPASEQPVSERLSYERSPDDIKKAIENSRAAREDARALLGIPEAANTARPPEPRMSEPAYAREAEIEERPAIIAQSRPSITESAAPKPALLSERVERQVAASFSELSEAFAARSRKTFDEMAEEMIAPLLRDWMENNLPTLVERLVREEIERVARGAL